MSQRNSSIRGQQYVFWGLGYAFSRSNAPDFKAEAHASQEKNHSLDLFSLLVLGLMFFWSSIFSPSSPEWHGMLYSQADSKKKSNLMMSLFEPGPEPLPWLGKMAQLGPISGMTQTRFCLDFVFSLLFWVTVRSGSCLTFFVGALWSLILDVAMENPRRVRCLTFSL